MSAARDRERDLGLYEKYLVKRTDGSSEAGGKHENCGYYVLDLVHDRFAIPALAAYAEACKDEFPALAADLRRLIAPTPHVDPRIEAAAQRVCEHVFRTAGQKVDGGRDERTDVCLKCGVRQPHPTAP